MNGMESNPYTSLTIEGFRGFRHFKIEDLACVNLFFGPNNCGKTTFLEAVFAHAAGHNLGPVVKQVFLHRSGFTVHGFFHFGELIRSVFESTEKHSYRFSISARLKGSETAFPLGVEYQPSSSLKDLDPGGYGGSWSEGEQQDAALSTHSGEEEGSVAGKNTPGRKVGVWKISMGEKTIPFDLFYPFSGFAGHTPFKLGIFNGLFSHRSSQADAMVFGQLKRQGVLGEFTRALNGYFPEIIEIDQIPYPDGSQGPVYATRKDGKRLPLWAFGDGMRRWYHLLGAMVVHKNACHCIEEIEAAFHPEAQRGFSRFLVEYALKFKNQLFLTSHSIEFADAFLDALYGENGLLNGASGDDDPVRIFSLQSSGDPPSIEVWPFRGRDAYLKRKSYDLEFR